MIKTKLQTVALHQIYAHHVNAITMRKHTHTHILINTNAIQQKAKEKPIDDIFTYSHKFRLNSLKYTMALCLCVRVYMFFSGVCVHCIYRYTEYGLPCTRTIGIN